jgi:NAD(P)-dependent dehydrogenase (short-subunit alcohol dehydrogenase family)
MTDKNILSQEAKVTVITGASSGIGRETARLFAEYESAVALLDIDKNNGEKTAEEIGASGGQAKFFPCDVSSDSDCKKAADAIFNEFGRIDTLFNNAGIVRRKSVLDLDEKEWDISIDVSLKGVYLLSKYVIPYMIKSGGGSIINTGSGWGIKGGPDAAAYCAAKGGVVNMTRAMAIDHGKDGIRVNCVCPGDIDTPLLHSEAAQLDRDDASFMKEAADRPLNRVGQPRDVAYTVLFLSSNMSGWITGTSIVVDGGGLA